MVGVDEEKLSTKEGENVKLLSGVVKKDTDEEVIWYFNDIRIAMINGGEETTCHYDANGVIFRGKLENDFKTGSLTINNIRPEHAGRYEAEYIERSNKRQSLSQLGVNRCDNTTVFKLTDSKYIKKIFNVEVIASPSETNEPRKGEKKVSDLNVSDPGLPSSAVVGIAVAFALLVIVAVGGGVLYKIRSKKANMKKNQPGLL